MEQKTREDFKTACDTAISLFEKNEMFSRVASQEMTKQDYVNFLLMIFHQTYHAGVTFALAGASCPNSYVVIRDYLIHHAEEEREHWQWVINDLKACGYEGPNPETLFPPPACQNYVAFNFFLSTRHPVARLGTAAVLEGIGAKYGGTWGKRLIEELDLQKNQVSFISSHGFTDVDHIKEIYEVLDKGGFNGDDWAWMCHAAECAGLLYKQMYDEVFSPKIERKSA